MVPMLQWCGWWRWHEDDHDDDDDDDDGDGDVVRRILCTYIPFDLAKPHFTHTYVAVLFVLVSLQLKKIPFLWLGRLFC